MMDILEKLEKMSQLPSGSPMPDWLSGGEQLSWDIPLRKLFYDAAEEIKRLRNTAGESKGSSFRDIMGEIRRGSSV